MHRRLAGLTFLLNMANCADLPKPTSVTVNDGSNWFCLTTMKFHHNCGGCTGQCLKPMNLFDPSTPWGYSTNMTSNPAPNFQLDYGYIARPTAFYIHLESATSINNRYQYTISTSNTSNTGYVSASPVLIGQQKSNRQVIPISNASTLGRYWRIVMESSQYAFKAQKMGFEACAVGFEWNKISGLCAPCAAGRKCSQQIGASSTACPAGTFSNAGATVCTACQAGSFTQFPGSSACLTCIPGTYNPTNGATSCIMCSAGTASAQSGLTQSCPQCAPQTYTDYIGQVTCIGCPVGQSAPNYGSSACVPCPAGSYYNTQDGGCTLCEAGTYADTSGNIDYCPGYCEVGFYLPNAGMTAPLPCPPGQYSGGLGAVTECYACPTDSYTDSPASSECMACPSGTTTQGLSGQSACS